jgi:hypothetical protein
MVPACKWLLIYDNVENSDLLLKYWPVASQGCAIITTRNPSIAYEPVETGIEILPFDREAGSCFILHLLSRDIAMDVESKESQSAIELSERLNGHALAITQMAGLIHRRSWTIEEFVKIYDRNTRKMLGMPGKNSLDAVWKLSFESLSPMCASLLGVLSFISPDSIPQVLFEPLDPLALPKSLQFCSDEFQYVVCTIGEAILNLCARFSEVLDDLLTLALIKREKNSRQLSLHRLVQAQFKYHLSPSSRQQAFENTVQLLCTVFPHANAKKGQLYDEWAECQLYFQHVWNLKNNYKESLTGSEPLKPTLAFFSLLKDLIRYVHFAEAHAKIVMLR